MDAPIRCESRQEPLDDEERELMNSDYRDWECADEGICVGEPGAILPIRFTRKEDSALLGVAHAQGMTTHEFIKRATLARLPHEVAS